MPVPEHALLIALLDNVELKHVLYLFMFSRDNYSPPLLLYLSWCFPSFAQSFTEFSVSFFLQSLQFRSCGAFLKAARHLGRKNGVWGPQPKIASLFGNTMTFPAGIFEFFKERDIKPQAYIICPQKNQIWNIKRIRNIFFILNIMI